MQHLRRLDIDDLLLLKNLLDGKTLTAVAASLTISQPAVSQRLRKISEAFGFDPIRQRGRRVELTEEGVALANQAVNALNLLQNAGTAAKDKVFNIGTRPEVGISWLGEAVFDLRKKHPQLNFHIHIASGSEILQRLGAGQLDAVLTSAPITVRDFRSLELADEVYVFAGTRELAQSIKKPEDLQKHVLIEYDRSFPFLRYLQADIRARVSFDDVWFLGSTELMARAIERGFGVGIVPRYLVRKSLESGRLTLLPFSKSLSHDSFRFVLRNDPVLEHNLALLAKQMQHIGLR